MITCRQYYCRDQVVEGSVVRPRVAQPTNRDDKSLSHRRDRHCLALSSHLQALYGSKAALESSAVCRVSSTLRCSNQVPLTLDQFVGAGSLQQPAVLLCSVTPPRQSSLRILVNMDRAFTFRTIESGDRNDLYIIDVS